MDESPGISYTKLTNYITDKAGWVIAPKIVHEADRCHYHLLTWKVVMHSNVPLCHEEDL